MITFFNRLLAKGGSWIMTILLAVIVVAFVFTIGAAPGLTEKERGLGDYDYYGVDLSPSSKERRKVVERAEMQATMQMGQFLNNPQYAQFAGQIVGRQTQSNVYDNIPLLKLANQIGIPAPSDEEGKAFIKEQSLFHNSQGKFSSEEYTKFQDRLDTNGNDAKTQFVQAVQEAITVEKIRNVLQGPGTALPFEATAKVRNDKTDWSVGVAILEAKDDTQENSPPIDDELKSLYEETKDTYATDETRKVSYLVFKSKHPHPTTEELKNTYNRNPKLYNPNINDEDEDAKPDTNDTKGVEDQENDEKPPEYPAYGELPYEIRLDVLDDYLAEKGLIKKGVEAARKEVESLLDVLYNNANYLKREEAERELKKLGIVRIKHIEAYAQNTPPAKDQFLQDLNAPFFDFSPSDADNKAVDDLFAEAFSLSEERFYSDPYKIGNNYVMLWLEKIEESQVPTLEELRSKPDAFSKLTQEWNKRKKAEALSARVKDVEKALQESIAKGSTLEASVQGIDSLIDDLKKDWNLTYKAHTSFNSDKLPEELPSQAFDLVKSLSKDSQSAMVSIEGKGYLLTVLDKKVPEYRATSSEVKTEFSRMKNRNSSSSFTQELVSKGMAAMRVNKLAEETEAN